MNIRESLPSRSRLACSRPRRRRRRRNRRRRKPRNRRPTRRRTRGTGGQRGKTPARPGASRRCEHHGARFNRVSAAASAATGKTGVIKDNEFIPTEEIQPDEAVTFPVDI